MANFRDKPRADFGVVNMLKFIDGVLRIYQLKSAEVRAAYCGFIRMNSAQRRGAASAC